MAERAHLSIGEVLGLLQDEFADITISKIRFLESQGLLDPERTPSGYRKFYEPDIERLRWILRQQKENFLPLKVIKDRLAEADAQGLAVPATRSVSATAVASEPALAEPTAPVAAAEPMQVADAPGPTRTSTPAASPAAAAPAPMQVANPLDPGPTGVSFTASELAEAAGLTMGQLRELERFGLLEGRSMGSDVFYDGEALVIGRTAAGFLRFGIEPRHLRSYKVAAEREAGFFEQVVLPLLKQRNPAAREQAATALGDLARLGDAMRAAMLRGALREHHL